MPEGTADLDLRVEACGPGDRAAQARLFNACFKKRIDERGLAWRYDRSPHGPAASFVTRQAGGEAVSGYACSPRLVLSHGDPSSLVAVGQTGDVMTHPDWRKRGLFSALDRAALAEARARGWPVVFGLPNRRSAHIFVELGWRAVGRVRTWTCLFRGGFEAREIRAREGRWRGWIAGFDVGRCRRARNRAASSARPLEVRHLERFPSEVTGLALRVAGRHALMVRRDADYLNWRFVDNVSRAHRIVGLFDGASVLRGYAVVQPAWHAHSCSYLVDVLGEDEGTEAAAVEAGLAALEAGGAAFAQATAIDGSWWSRRLAASGFLPPSAAHHLAVIVHVLDPGHPLVRVALDPTSWYLTDGDRDDETMG